MLAQIRQFTKEHRLGTSIASTTILVLIIKILNYKPDVFENTGTVLGLIAPSILIFLSATIRESRESFMKLILIYNIIFSVILFLLLFLGLDNFNKFFYGFVISMFGFYMIYYFIEFRNKPFNK
ncbi:MAG: hypothetical protein WCT77_14165 [Bacteroidota bacterium]